MNERETITRTTRLVMAATLLAAGAGTAAPAAAQELPSAAYRESIEVRVINLEAVAERARDMQPGDRAAVVAWDGRNLEMLSGWTSSPEEPPRLRLRSTTRTATRR